MKHILLLLSVTMWLSAADDPHANDRKELLALMTTASEALTKRDLNALEALFYKPYIFVMSDQTRITNMDELRKADEEWFQGPNAPITKISFTPVVDGHATFLSDTIAVASGTCTDTVTLRDGGDVQMTSRWTATVIKTPDGWRVASVHSGVSPTDNPVVKRLVDSITMTALIAGGIALVVGLLVGLLLGRRRKAA